MQAKLVHIFSVLKLPMALALVGLLALDSYLGLNLGEPVTIMLAAAAGALGVKRPGDLSEKAAQALKESQQ